MDFWLVPIAFWKIHSLPSSSVKLNIIEGKEKKREEVETFEA
jgi:hypothetical protein